MNNSSLESVLSRAKSLDVKIRIDMDDEGYYASIIDEQKYPRIWTDCDIAGEFKPKQRSEESALQSATHFLEKDWVVRFFDTDISSLAKKLYDYLVFEFNLP